MPENIYKFKSVILDTGPLLLYLIGFFHVKYLEKFDYNTRELILLNEFLKNFPEIMVTPQVLAEMSDLVKSRLKQSLFSAFIQTSFMRLFNLGEEYITKNEIMKNEQCLPMFGITDTSLLSAARKNILLLTDDGPFYSYCNSIGIRAVHLDELQALLVP